MNHDKLDTIDGLADLIREWGLDRMIVQNSTPLAQSRKTIEEVHEMVEAAAQIDVLKELKRRTNGILTSNEVLLTECGAALEDAIGDVFVTLVMVASCSGLDPLICIQRSYNEIKDRKGHLREDGVFVKE